MLRHHHHQVSAIVDLWRSQLDNEAEHPRKTAEINQAIKTFMERNCKIREKNYEDPGVGSLLDGYTTTEEMKRISECYLYNGKTGIRDRSGWLFMHQTLERSDGARRMNKSNIFAVELELEVSMKWMINCFIFASRGGKPNKFGHMMYSGMLRHRNPELCGWGGFALHEFEKYHILGEPFPLMDKKQGW
ncbi:unnamed protein product, partial [Heterosigma akashiwo]